MITLITGEKVNIRGYCANKCVALVELPDENDKMMTAPLVTLFSDEDGELEEAIETAYQFTRVDPMGRLVAMFSPK